MALTLTDTQCHVSESRTQMSGSLPQRRDHARVASAPAKLLLSASLPAIRSSVALRPYSLALAAFLSFVLLHTIGRTPWTGDQPVARHLPTHMTAQTQNKST
jgi:hypothetical protein